jgi:hypothetical protein
MANDQGDGAGDALVVDVLWTVLPMRSRRSDDKPTVSGLTTGWSCASALLEVAKTKRIRTKYSLRDLCADIFMFSSSPLLSNNK